ncbi:hypothetical protein BUALT_Bualt12G0079600 [Buddleja alternifolia]|uniref:DUF4283 domain-containing protein n=1 Tax=Buddleja alternifolia TaxID=168488 RepID=A0AAV6WPZ6_9LAMI|nr:hypothetical protein BUALT_Bualt12G0079600 [Buddleja alternifolia]
MVLPSITQLRKAFHILGLKGAFQIGSFYGYPMRVFKWDKNFSLSEESPIAPVWVNFPGHPVQYFARPAFLSIAGILGKPLQIDDGKKCILCPELKIVYAHLPQYCNYCKHSGHEFKSCLGKGLMLTQVGGPSGGSNFLEKAQINVSDKEEPNNESYEGEKMHDNVELERQDDNIESIEEVEVHNENAEISKSMRENVLGANEEMMRPFIADVGLESNLNNFDDSSVAVLNNATKRTEKRSN